MHNTYMPICVLWAGGGHIKWQTFGGIICLCGVWFHAGGWQHVWASKGRPTALKSRAMCVMSAPLSVKACLWSSSNNPPSQTHAPNLLLSSGPHRWGAPMVNLGGKASRVHPAPPCPKMLPDARHSSFHLVGQLCRGVEVTQDLERLGVGLGWSGWRRMGETGCGPL